MSYREIRPRTGHVIRKMVGGGPIPTLSGKSLREAEIEDVMEQLEDGLAPFFDKVETRHHFFEEADCVPDEGDF